MPLQATSGAASYDAFGGGVPVVPNYIEDVFSTWLYEGNGSTQTITNGIDLSTNGGLVWIKNRQFGYDHALFDTARGSQKYIRSNTTNAESTSSTSLTGFTTSGFSLSSDGFVNNGGSYPSFASWTFRKQPKFFDVVTYTGDGTANRQISHALGSTPGCVIVKNTTDAGTGWIVWHRSINGVSNLFLNTTDSVNTLGFEFLVGTDATVFTITTAVQALNQSGKSYVAYLFAHNAGGFGLTGTDNVISCGSFTTNGSGAATVSLGYEPQWFLFKRTDDTSNWRILDVMRGGSLTQSSPLIPNLSSAESSFGSFWSPTATGFNIINQAASSTWIYIAIRRGPMRTPTTGTSVFAPVNQTGGGTVTTNFPVDLLISTTPSQSSYRSVNDRLRGASTTRDVPLYTNTTDAETVGTGYGFGFDNNTGFKDANYSSSFTDLYLSFRRAPSFFDEVCYTGTGSARTVTHNLAAVPEMMLIKRRDTTAQWQFYFAGLGNTKSVQMPDNDKVTSSGLFNNTSPTSSVFTVGVNSPVNASGGTYVAYLAATCAGVSKVGTYTGTGTTQQIDCGFAAGARFVLIKNVGVNDYAYGYYVWDTARGIVSGNDPYLLLNSTAAEVTNTDYIDTYSAGFEISSTAPAGINANGDQFVYWAIA